MNYEIKTLPSGIIIENRPSGNYKYRWCIKNTWIVHNEGEPAAEHKDGTKYWYQHHILHRLDGPAIEYLNGNKYYSINDILYSDEGAYWKHPDVMAYKYLQEHPELEGFI